MNTLVDKFIEDVVNFKKVNYRKYADAVVDSVVEEYVDNNVAILVGNYSNAITDRIRDEIDKMFDEDIMIDNLKTRTDVNFLFPNQISSNVERSIHKLVVDTLVPGVHEFILNSVYDECADAVCKCVRKYVKEEINVDIIKDNIDVSDTVYSRCQRSHLKPNEIRSSILDALKCFD